MKKTFAFLTMFWVFSIFAHEACMGHYEAKLKAWELQHSIISSSVWTRSKDRRVQELLDKIEAEMATWPVEERTK